MNTTPTPSDLPELSADTVRDLKKLRTGDRQTFYAYVTSLRANRWPLRAIAGPLGVSRTAVQRWQKLYDASVHLPVTEELPAALPKRIKPVYQRFELSEDQKSELRKLAHEASKVRRYTDLKSRSREDAKTLEFLLRNYSAHGVSLSQLAEASGVSRSSVAQRLRKPQP